MPRKKTEVDLNRKLTAYTVYTAKDEIDRDFGKVELYSAKWDYYGMRIKNFFENHHVEHSYFDIDEQKNYQRFVELLKKIKNDSENTNIPVVTINDRMLVKPSLQELQKELLIEDTQARELFDVVVVGGGIAGFSAALNCSLLGLKTILLEKNVLLSRLSTLPWIHNFTGYSEGIEGRELALHLRNQFEEQYDLVVVEGVTAKRIKQVGKLYEVSTDGAIYRSKSVVIAAGAVYSKLNVQGENELYHRGIFYDVKHDYISAKGKDVILAGVDESIFEDALLLAEYASRVTVLNLGNKKDLNFFMEKKFGEKNITLVNGARILEFRGNVVLEAVKYFNSETGKTYIPEVSVVFISLPNSFDTRWLSNVIALDDDGMILRNEGFETNWKGVFAAGDSAKKTNTNINVSYFEGANVSLKAKEFVDSWK